MSDRPGDQIAIRGMIFQGRIGVLDAERVRAQPIEVDVTLSLDLSVPAASDQLADSIDYAASFDTVRTIVEEGSFHLMEALAAAIANALLETPRIDEVEVAVRKPKAPLPGAFEAVEVRLHRRRALP